MYRFYRRVYIFAGKFIRVMRSLAFDYLSAGRNLGAYDRSYSYSSGANPSQSTPLWIIRYIFKRLYQVKTGDVLVDAGCGNGRVIMWWLKRFRRNKIYGVELDPRAAEETRKLFRKHQNVEIITGDILNCLPDDATVFYLFNPFQQKIVSQFKKRLEKTYPKGITIIYYYPLCYSIFKIDPKWQVGETVKPDVKFSRRADFPFVAIMQYKGAENAAGTGDE